MQKFTKIHIIAQKLQIRAKILKKGMIKMQDQEKNLSHLPKVSADNKAKSISTSVEIENSIIVNKIQNMQYAKSKLALNRRGQQGKPWKVFPLFRC